MSSNQVPPDARLGHGRGCSDAGERVGDGVSEEARRVARRPGDEAAGDSGIVAEPGPHRGVTVTPVGGERQPDLGRTRRDDAVRVDSELRQRPRRGPR